MHAFNDYANLGYIKNLWMHIFGILWNQQHEENKVLCWNKNIIYNFSLQNEILKVRRVVHSGPHLALASSALPHPLGKANPRPSFSNELIPSVFFVLMVGWGGASQWTDGVSRVSSWRTWACWESWLRPCYPEVPVALDQARVETWVLLKSTQISFL